MRITLLTYGSRGDVEPFVALGEGLMDAGFQVRLAAPYAFSSPASSRDIAFVGLPGNPERLIQGLVKAGSNGWPGMVRAASRYVMPLAAEVFAATRKACEDAEGIVHSFLLTLAGQEIALEKGIPDVSAQLFPVFSRTTEFPAVFFPDLPLGAAYKGITHGIVNQTFWQTSRLLYGWIRRSNPQLPELSGWPFSNGNDRSPPILYAFSPQVVSRPKDWPADRHVNGYWFLEDETAWEPPRGLVSFLKAGSPPVCIGLGSTVTRDQEKLSQIVVEALSRSGQRGVIAGTSLAVGKDPENIFQTEYVPYSWLFPFQRVLPHARILCYNTRRDERLDTGFSVPSTPRAAEAAGFTLRCDDLGREGDPQNGGDTTRTGYPAQSGQGTQGRPQWSAKRAGDCVRYDRRAERGTSTGRDPGKAAGCEGREEDASPVARTLSRRLQRRDSGESRPRGDHRPGGDRADHASLCRCRDQGVRGERRSAGQGGRLRNPARRL